MRALVTGGTGFIGRHVVSKLLDDGHEVRVFSRRGAGQDLFGGRGVDIAAGDLADPGTLVEALAGTDVLYHIGEIKNTTKSEAEKNVRLIEEVTREARRQQLKRIVFVSSISVSGIPSVIPADEDTLPRAVLNDQYTDCKRRSEEILIKNAGDVEYAIIRPAPVYGPGSRYLGRLISVIESLGPLGIPFPGNARNIAPLIHVKDLAAAISAAGIKPDAAGRIFNLTDGLRHSWRDFFETIAERLGSRKLRIIPLPRLLLKLTAAPLDLVSVFFGTSFDPLGYITYFSEDLFFDNSRARTLLDWQPRYSLHEGIDDMIAFYRQEGR